MGQGSGRTFEESHCYGVPGPEAVMVFGRNFLPGFFDHVLVYIQPIYIRTKFEGLREQPSGAYAYLQNFAPGFRNLIQEIGLVDVDRICL